MWPMQLQDFLGGGQQAGSMLQPGTVTLQLAGGPMPMPAAAQQQQQRPGAGASKLSAPPHHQAAKEPLSWTAAVAEAAAQGVQENPPQPGDPTAPQQQARDSAAHTQQAIADYLAQQDYNHMASSVQGGRACDTGG